MTRITITDEIEVEFERIRQLYNIPYMTKPLDLIKFLILKTQNTQNIEIKKKDELFTKVEKLHKTLPKTKSLTQEEIDKLIYEETIS
jgi:hypothetical protein